MVVIPGGESSVGMMREFRSVVKKGNRDRAGMVCVTWVTLQL